MLVWETYLDILTHGLQRKTGGGASAYYAAIYAITPYNLTRFNGTPNFWIRPEEEGKVRQLVGAMRSDGILGVGCSGITLGGIKFVVCGCDREEHGNPVAKLRAQGPGPQLELFALLEERNSVTMNGSPLLFCGAVGPGMRTLVRENLTNTGQKISVDLQ